MACGSQREPPYRASARMMVVGSPSGTSMREGASSLWWRKGDGWPSRLAVRSTSPKHVDGVPDCMVLGCGLSPSVCGVAGDDGGAEQGNPASASAWRLGSVASPEETWVLMTFSCHPSPTTS